MKEKIHLIVILFAVLCLACSSAFAEKYDLVIGVPDWSKASDPVLEYLYLQHFPEGSVTYRVVDVTNAEELQVSDLDLLLLDNIGLAYAEQHELLVDLYAYLDKDFWENGWMNLRSLCERQGCLQVMPRTLRQKAWMWNETLADQLEIQQPQMPWSWTDFLELNTLMSGDGVRGVFLISGSNHISGVLNNFMPDPMEELFSLYFLEEITPERINEVFQVFSATYCAGTLCPPGQENVQLLCMPVSPGAYLQITDEWDSSYVFPPCLDISAPRYICYGTFLCAPKGQKLSSAAITCLQILTGEEAQIYYSSNESIFTKEPPRYLVSYEGELKRTYSAEDLPNYSLTDSVLFSQEGFANFVFQREHAYQSQSYDWLTLFPGMLSTLSKAMDQGYGEDTYASLMQLLNQCMK